MKDDYFKQFKLIRSFLGFDQKELKLMSDQFKKGSIFDDYAIKFDKSQVGQFGFFSSNFLQSPGYLGASSLIDSIVINQPFIKNLEKHFIPFFEFKDSIPKNLNNPLFDSFKFVVPEFKSLYESFPDFKSSFEFIEEEDYEEDEEPKVDSKIEVQSIIGITFGIITEVTNNLNKLYTMSPSEFEELIAEIFLRFNHKVERTQQTRDGGYDLSASLETESGEIIKYLIECKRYAKENKVGVGVVRSLNGILDINRANKGLIVTTSTFSKDAIQAASQVSWRIGLHDVANVKNWLNKLK